MVTTGKPPGQKTPTPTGSPVVKNVHDKKEDLPDTDKNESDGAPKRIHSPLHKIAITLAQTIIKEKLEGTIKESLDEIISYIQSEEMREQQKSREAKITAEEIDLRKGINSDVTKLFNALSEQLIGIQNTSSVTAHIEWGDCIEGN
jgi:hypothetical protein